MFFPSVAKNTNCGGERKYSMKMPSSRKYVVANLPKKNLDLDRQQRSPNSLTPWKPPKDNFHKADLTETSTFYKAARLIYHLDS